MDFEKLNIAIAEEYEVPIEKIQPQADIRQTLDLDSMRAMSMVVIVKRTCGIIIPPRHLPRFTNYQSLYDYINDKSIK